MAQQTAVEWLMQNIEKTLPNFIEAWRVEYEQAKQMEKEQMLWFFRKFHMINEESNSHYIKEFEHHYNETYKTQ